MTHVNIFRQPGHFLPQRGENSEEIEELISKLKFLHHQASCHPVTYTHSLPSLLSSSSSSLPSPTSHSLPSPSTQESGSGSFVDIFLASIQHAFFVCMFYC